MNTCRVQFRATAIKPKEFIGDEEMDLGSFSGGAYGMLNFLENIDKTMTLQQMYKLRKPIEFCVEGDSQNNLCIDWNNNDIVKRLKENRFPIYLKLERISPNQRTGK